jgi:hypothetical protein
MSSDHTVEDWQVRRGDAVLTMGSAAAAAAAAVRSIASGLN